MILRTIEARGFTLIEIIVVLAIVAVVMGLSLPSIERLREDSLVESASQKIASIIKEGRSLSISDHAAKLVVINDTQVKVYQEGVGTVVDWHKLPKGLTMAQTGFTTTNIPYPSDTDEAHEKPVIEFSPTGNVEQGGEITITSNNDATRKRRITISTATGKVKVEK